MNQQAMYALLGAIVSSAVTLAALFVRHVLGLRVETKKHEWELEKLRIELENGAAQRQDDSLRKLAASFLGASHEAYGAIVDARRHRRQDGDTDSYISALRSVPFQRGQLSLEELRLSSSGNLLNSADLLWQHIRQHEVPMGVNVKSDAWVSWKSHYWDLRTAFVEECKRSLDGLGQIAPSGSAIRMTRDQSDNQTRG